MQDKYIDIGDHHQIIDEKLAEELSINKRLSDRLKNISEAEEHAFKSDNKYRRNI